VIYFRCDRCAGVIRADEDRAGTELRCTRCAHGNLCPSDTVRRAFPTGTSPSPLRIGVAVLLLAALGWATWNALLDVPAPRAVPSEPLTSSAADRRQEEILRQAVDYAPDPALVGVYDEINARHFDAFLPPIPVVWEPRLGDVGQLAAETFTLEGMFGHIGDRAVILLNPSLARDPAALRRTLSHEMVHAWLYVIGDTSTDHGPAFQATLKRLAAEGAFPGIVATAGERESLRAWLTSESARLDALSEEGRRESAALAREARDIEQALADLNAHNRPAPHTPTEADRSIADWTLRRDAYNRRVLEFRARGERHRADLAAFNAQVERHNLMLSYPDGLDRQDHVANRR
jgi:hypothetical protein